MRRVPAWIFVGVLGCGSDPVPDAPADTDADVDDGDGSASGGVTETGEGDTTAALPVVCVSDMECDDGSPCTDDRCDAGACVHEPLDGVDARLEWQTAGDCSVVTCAAGEPGVRTEDGDAPDDRNGCTADTCEDGAPIHPPLRLGFPCGDGFFCDGAGSCNECNAAEDCDELPPRGECSARACLAGACMQSFVPADTPVESALQTDGDCRLVVCDGAGGLVSQPDDADVPVDGIACTQDVCEAGEPSNPPSALGSACDDGLQCTNDACDGAGACVGEPFALCCSDGTVDPNEECDDGNLEIGDGCDAECDAEVIEIAAGGAHTCVRRSNATVRCWGYGGYSALGYGNQTTIGDNEVPAVAGDVDVGAPVDRIDAGGSFACAVLPVGAVRCWGGNWEGQLGQGNLTKIGDDEVPAEIGDIDLGGPAVAIAAGLAHACALLEGGAVRCWGSGFTGQLGHGDVENVGDDETPASVGDVNLGGVAVEVAAGGFHTCARLDTGAVRCWGDGLDGQLGYGDVDDIGDDEAPASAGDVDVGGTVVQLGLGTEHTCARLDTGAVRCWGRGASGQLGHASAENIGDDESPASAGDVDLGGVAIDLAVGGDHTCALLDTGAVRCWGDSSSGALGYGDATTIGDDETPASAGDLDLGALAVDIDALASHTCARLDTGGVRCWGLGTLGRLGYASTETIGDDEPPAAAGEVQVY